MQRSSSFCTYFIVSIGGFDVVPRPSEAHPSVREVSDVVVRNRRVGHCLRKHAAAHEEDVTYTMTTRCKESE